MCFVGVILSLHPIDNFRNTWFTEGFSDSSSQSYVNMEELRGWNMKLSRAKEIAREVDERIVDVRAVYLGKVKTVWRREGYEV